MKRSIFVFCMVVAVAISSYAQENINLGQIVVTPAYGGGGKSIYNVAYSVQQFNRNDIENKGAGTLLEFLRKISSMNVSDWYGTGVKANVDLMGFGDNALSNILVLVNGRRINDIDLSGIDWTQIPVDNIEKIEIIKGGAEVLYGDNASGGIINIITRKPQAGPLNVEMKSEGGSYSYDKESLYIVGGRDGISFSAYAEHSSTNGYRKNSHYRSRYADIELNGQLDEKTRLSIEGGHHRYRYGLAGAIYESDLSGGYTRRDSKYPDDNARLEDNYIATSLTHKFSPITKMVMDIAYRNKNGVDNWLSYGGWNSIVDKHISNVNITNRLFMQSETGDIHHDLIAGFEMFQADFSADTDDLSIFNSDNSTDIDRSYYAIFINDTISLTESTSINLGARTQKEKFEFDYYSSTIGVDDNLHFREEAYEIGINHRIGDNNFFMNLSRSFRVPKTDEYFSAFATPPVNKDLSPQISKTVTAGFNLTPTDKIILKMDFFVMNIDNELYYDPLTFANGNYPKTRHRGLNLLVRYRPASYTELSFGYRATEAKFKKGPYAGEEIPAVPHSKLTISFTQKFGEFFTFNLDTVYRSKTYLINDLNNSLDKLNSFWVTNINIKYKHKNMELYAGIKNLFNEQYTEYAATNSTGTVKALYPAPERNYFWGVKVNF